MPLLTLPPEVIEEIVSYLRSPFLSRANHSLEAGKAISLVSRRFRTSGQALRWRSVTIDCTSLTSLSDHFVLHPQLASLVRHLGTTNVDSVDDHLSLLSLLHGTTSLRSFSITGKIGQSLEGIIEAAGRLAHLQHLVVDSHGSINWSPRISSLLLTSFPSLVDLTVRADHLSLSESINLQTSTQPPLRRLKALVLNWKTESPAAFGCIMRLFDLTTLRQLCIGGPSLILPLLQQFAQLVDLRWLTLRLGFRDIASALPRILDHLPELKALEDLDLLPHGRMFGPVHSPVPLETFLAALPPSLLYIHMRHVWFRKEEVDSIPLRKVDCPSAVDLCVFEARRGRSVDVKLWRNKANATKGWYRARSRG